jgi:hypothetical protein
VNHSVRSRHLQFLQALPFSSPVVFGLRSCYLRQISFLKTSPAIPYRHYITGFSVRSHTTDSSLPFEASIIHLKSWHLSPLEQVQKVLKATPIRICNLWETPCWIRPPLASKLSSNAIHYIPHLILEQAYDIFHKHGKNLLMKKEKDVVCPRGNHPRQDQSISAKNFKEASRKVSRRRSTSEMKTLMPIRFSWIGCMEMIDFTNTRNGRKIYEPAQSDQMLQRRRSFMLDCTIWPTILASRRWKILPWISLYHIFTVTSTGCVPSPTSLSTCTNVVLQTPFLTIATAHDVLYFRTFGNGSYRGAVLLCPEFGVDVLDCINDLDGARISYPRHESYCS